MPLLFELGQSDFEFLLEQGADVVGGASQDFAYANEDGLAFVDHAGVGRDRNLAIGEGVQGVDGGLCVRARREGDDDLGVFSRIVFDFLDLYLAFGVGGDDRVDERAGGRAKGNLGDRQLVLASDLKLRADEDLAATQPVVVVREVGVPSRIKIWVQLERLLLEVGDGSVDDLDEIVRQHLAGEPNRDPFAAFGENEREFGRQVLWLLVAPVVGSLPHGGLGIEDDFSGKGRQPRFDVTSGSGSVAGKRVAPVALGIDEQVALAHADHGGVDAGIAVRVVAHGVADHVGDLVVAPVVQLLERVQDATLHRLEAVVERRDRAVENDVGGVFKKPALVGLSERRLLVAAVDGLRFDFFCGVEIEIVLLVVVLAHASTKSCSMRRFSMMNAWRSGVFFPM